MEPLRWHSWHRSWRIGATSLANVGWLRAGAEPVKSAASEIAGTVRKALSAHRLIPVRRGTENRGVVIMHSFHPVSLSDINDCLTVYHHRKRHKRGMREPRPRE